MGPQLRNRWRLLGLPLASPRLFRLALWTIRRLGLR
jgi:hypothetical protein